MTNDARELPLLQSFAELGRLVFDAGACSIALLEDDDEHLRFRAASGEGADQVIGLRLPVNRGLAGWAVSSGQAIVVEDVRQDPRFAADVAEATGYVPRSILVMPLPGGHEGLGVIEVLDRRRVEGRDDLAILATLAAAASSAWALAEQVVSAQGLASSPAAVALERLNDAGPAELATATALLQTLSDYVEAKRGLSGLV